MDLISCYNWINPESWKKYLPIAELKKEQLLEYCKDQSSADSELLTELEKYTWDNEDVPQMITGQLVGKFLQASVKMSNAKR